MANEEEDAFGRRSADRYPSPEAVGLLLAQIRGDLAELKADVKEGFAEFKREFDQLEKRTQALERFRERVEERDRAVAKDQEIGSGRISFRIPVLAAFLVALGLIVAIVTTLATSSP